MVVATYNSCLQAALSIPGYTESDATYSLGEKISALNIRCLHVRMWERLIEVSLLHVQDYKDLTALEPLYRSAAGSQFGSPENLL